MDSVQLLRVLKGDDMTRRDGIGVFPADRLPPVNTYPSALVVNTDESNRPGTHWLAMYFTKDGRAEFFDSYGLPPDTYGQHFQSFLRNNSSQFIRNAVRLQSLTTMVCGQHCLFYLLHRCRDISMRAVVFVFTDDYLVNDVMVQDFIEQNYNVDVPVLDLDFICRQICVKKN